MRVSLPYAQADDRDDGVTHSADIAEVGDLWRILWSRRALILGFTAVSIVGALIYDVVAPPQYAATAQILIDPRDRQIVTKDVNPDTLSPDGGVVQIESQARVIESDSVLLRAVDSAGLASDADYGGPSTSFIGKLLESLSSEPGANASRNKALRVLRKHLSVKRADKVFVVDVTVTAATAEKAARVSDAIADAYIADQVSARGESSRKASDELAGRLVGLREKVKEYETRVERYRAAHDIIGTDKQLITDQQLGDTGTKLADARAKAEELRARVDQIEALRRSGADAGSIPEALQSTVITQLRSSAQELLRRESDLRTRVGDRHPDMIAVVEQVREVKGQITAELGRLARSARSDYERAIAYQRTLSANLDQSKAKTIAAGEDSVELRELNRELDARRSLYQAFLARSAETKAQADIDTTNARILSKAIPPDQPSWPPRGFILLGAIGGGLGVGIGLALVAEYFAPTVLSFGQLQRLVEAPVIGVLPAAWSGKMDRRSGRRIANRTDERTDTEVALALSRLCGPLGALRGAPEPYSLLLTSTQGDGSARTDVADRIVAATEERGLAVLLVEASNANGVRGAKGFLDVLRGDCSLSAATQGHGARSAKLIGIGSPGAKFANDVSEQTVERFMESAARYFDLVVFDGGAFEQNLRMAPLASRVDDVLLVAVQGRTRQKAALAVTNAVLATSGGPVSASVLVEPDA